MKKVGAITDEELFGLARCLSVTSATFGIGPESGRSFNVMLADPVVIVKVQKPYEIEMSIRMLSQGGAPCPPCFQFHKVSGPLIGKRRIAVLCCRRWKEDFFEHGCVSVSVETQGSHVPAYRTAFDPPACSLQIELSCILWVELGSESGLQLVETCCLQVIIEVAAPR